MKDFALKDHLTDDEFASCLDGTPPKANLQAHLGVCEQCQIEMDLFQTSMAEFGGAAIGWSRTQPVPSLRPVVLAKRKASIAIGLQWAVAAMLLIGIGVPVFLHTEHPQHAAGNLSAAASSDDSDSQIAQDNAMLSSVNQVIASTEPSPFQQYDLPIGPQKRTKSHLSSRAQ